MEIAVEDLESIAENVWGTTLGITVSRLPDWAGPDAHPDMLIAMIGIRGAWRGTVIVHCPQDLASIAASLIFDIAPGTPPSTAEMRDALLELTNMIGGNMKALLPEPCELALPVIVDPVEHLEPSGAKIAELALACDSFPLLVGVYEDGETA